MLVLTQQATLNDSKAFIENWNDMNDIYKNIEDYNPDKKRKILIVFNDMIADILSNKRLDPVVTELLIRGRKLNISLIFITKSYFATPKYIALNSLHYFIMKITNKQELQQIASNHPSNIDIRRLHESLQIKYHKIIFIFSN